VLLLLGLFLHRIGLASERKNSAMNVPTAWFYAVAAPVSVRATVALPWCDCLIGSCGNILAETFQEKFACREFLALGSRKAK
jgi:hypothetical protein